MRFLSKADAPKKALKKEFRYEPGCAYRVKALDYRNRASKQLVDMGITPDTVISIENAAPLGEPLVVRVRDYKVALRSRDLMALTVEPQMLQAQAG